MLERCCLAASWRAVIGTGSSRGLPWHLKSGAAFAVQVVSSRRGLKNQLKTLLWRSKSSAATREQEARDGSQTPRGAVVGQPYAAASMEGQLRQLADLAFMMQDYETAVSTLKLLSSDARADKAWKAYAGAQVGSVLPWGVGDALCFEVLCMHLGQSSTWPDPSVCLDAKMLALTNGSVPCRAAPSLVQSSAVCVDAVAWLRRRC